MFRAMHTRRAVKSMACMLKVTVDQDYIWKPGGDITLDALSRVNTILYDTIRLDIEYLTCSKKLTCSQLSPHGAMSIGNAAL